MVPEVLSQAEIDALLQALSSGHVDIEAIKKSEEEKKFKVYDFRRPDKFSKDQLRAIQMVHESFARQVTTAISTMARSLVSAEVASVDQISYDEFVRSLVQPTVIAVLDMYPLSGSAMLEIAPSLIFAIIDRSLGGKGESLSKPRSLTDIERMVAERVFMRILELLEESWSTVVDLKFRFVNLESNPFFVQICPGSDMVLVVTLKVQLGNIEGLMNFCVPYFVMEPVVDRLSSQRWFASTGRKGTENAKAKLAERLKDIKVPVVVELGHAEIELKELLGLRPGDVIRLEESYTDPVAIRIGSNVKFYATPGTSKGRYAVRITDVVQKLGAEEEDMAWLMTS
ncbi:MAG TPA: flagellar motor switch protein FliM [Synergistaceae bacterium]|nr:flagellar motor switch protein FliM [Synergistaceae bacterium]